MVELATQSDETARDRVVDDELAAVSCDVQAHLPRPLDGSVRMDETRGLNPLGREVREAAPETFPFGI